MEVGRGVGNGSEGDSDRCRSFGSGGNLGARSEGRLPFYSLGENNFLRANGPRFDGSRGRFSGLRRAGSQQQRQENTGQ